MQQTVEKHPEGLFFVLNFSMDNVNPGVTYFCVP
jgi:hypothetical protein